MQAEGKADLSVKNIRAMPTFPKPGEEVVFMASLINNGTGETKVGDSHLIRFYVNGEEIARYHSSSLAIPVGGMELVCAEGLEGINWKASEGNFIVEASIETARGRDLNPENNRCKGELAIPNGKVIPAEIAKILMQNTN